MTRTPKHVPPSPAHKQAQDLIDRRMYDAAVQAYAAILGRNDKDAAAWYGISLAQAALGQADIAEKFLRAAVANDPDFVPALATLGARMLGVRNYAEAEPLLERARRNEPQNATHYSLLGAALIGGGKIADALRVLEAGYALAPRDADLIANYMIALRRAGRPREALDLLGRMSAAERRKEENILLESRLRLEAGDYAGLSALCERMLKTAPYHPEFTVMKAQAMKHEGAYEDAAALLHAAMPHMPAQAAPQMNGAIGMMEYAAGRLETALAHYERALYDTPASPALHYNTALCLLSLGRYDAAWPHFEWRMLKDGVRPLLPLSRPVWTGEALGRQTLLVYEDYGVGDLICMARYLPMIRRDHKDARIVVEVARKMIPLLEDSFGDIVDAFVATSANPPHAFAGAYDAHIAFMSLPAVFGTQADNVPQAGGYLTRKEARPALEQGRPLRIGVSWHSANPENGHLRSMDPADFAALVAGVAPPVEFVNLQYKAGAEDLAALQDIAPVAQTGVEVFDDLCGMARLIETCDIVASIDNTTVHMAGAMGVPCMVFLHDVPDWRWGRAGHLAAWYESLRLYRRAAGEDWGRALAQARDDLVAFVAAKGWWADAGSEDREGEDAAMDATGKRRKNGKVPAPRKRAVLLNDTGNWYHWGCYGTSMALREAIGAEHDLVSVLHQEIAACAAPHPEKIEDFDSALLRAQWRMLAPTVFAAMERADVVYINGEGTIHGLSPMSLKLMYLAYMGARHMGKEVHIVNHACFPQSGTTLDNPVVKAVYAKVYGAVAGVVVRDPVSQGLLRQVGVEARLGFDCLPLYIAGHWGTRMNEMREPAAQEMIIAGSSAFADNDDLMRVLFEAAAGHGLRPVVLLGAPRDAAQDDDAFLAAVTRVAGAQGPKGAWDCIHAASFAEWIARIGRARIMVGGRFHYSIAAWCAGTPFVAFEGNTPKMAALADRFGLPAPLPYRGDDVAGRMIKRIDAIMREGKVKNDLLDARLREISALSKINFS